MRKFLIILLIVLAGAPVFCAGNASEHRSAQKRINDSHKKQYQACINIQNNFRYDHQISNYFKSRCQLFQSDRQRLLSTIFTISSSNNKNGVMEDFSSSMADFVVKLNNDEINRFKNIVQEYCKFNAYKFEKRDPEACSPQRIQKLF